MRLAIRCCVQIGGPLQAYAYTRGIGEAKLAIARGIGAAFGLLGTFIFPRLSKSYSINKTGAISIWLQVRPFFESASS